MNMQINVDNVNNQLLQDRSSHFESQPDLISINCSVDRTDENIGAAIFYF